MSGSHAMRFREPLNLASLFRLRLLTHIIAVKRISFSQVQSTTNNHRMRPSPPLPWLQRERADFSVPLRRCLHQGHHTVLVVKVQPTVSIRHRCGALALPLTPVALPQHSAALYLDAERPSLVIRVAVDIIADDHEASVLVCQLT